MELIEKLFLEDAENEDEVSDVYRDQNGIFYVFDGEEYKPVPASIQKSLAKKYHVQKRIQQAIDAGKDIDELKAEHEKRMQLKNTMSIETAEKEQRKNIQAAMYRHREEEEEERKRRKERAENRPRVVDGKEQDEVCAELLKSIHDFVSNQIYDEDQVNVEYSYEEPDPYETVDPDIFTQSRTYSHHKNEEEPEEKERPLVLFYFDRSGSFDPDIAPQKTALGTSLMNLFTGENDLDVDVIYFATNIYPLSEYADAEQRALRDGGNSGRALLRDIRERTAGRLANVVVLTDSDSEGGLSVYINGSIWLIFAGSWDRSFAESLKKATPETKKRIFYFDEMYR